MLLDQGDELDKVRPLQLLSFVLVGENVRSRRCCDDAGKGLHFDTLFCLLGGDDLDPNLSVMSHRSEVLLIRWCSTCTMLVSIGLSPPRCGLSDSNQSARSEVPANFDLTNLLVSDAEQNCRSWDPTFDNTGKPQKSKS
jgi:hypothetical protein